MLKYVSKFVLDILPSVVATIIGAYVVNYYIIPKAGTNAPVAAAASTVLPKADVNAPATATPETAAAAEAPKVKAPVEKAAAEKAPAEKASIEKNTTEKAADKPTETASIPVEYRRRPAREKSVAKAAPASAPAAPAPSAALPVDNLLGAEERRDANDLARAAIERLRISNEAASHAARGPDTPRPAASAVVQALPPAIVVSTPRTEPFKATAASQNVVDTDDSQRPPAEIPASRPIDLHAEAMAASGPERTTVAEDMLTAAKSVFRSVLPR
jgi:hypothetical protein